MFMKNKIFTLTMVVMALFTNAQGLITTEAKGVGADRDGALQDAMRNAVAQACGTAIQSVTQMQNYVAIKDAVSTQTSGWIKNYNIVSETPLSETFEVIIKANVSTSALEQDIKTLSQWLGGLQFLVFFDPRDVPSEEYKFYDWAYDRFNEKLKEKEYKYIEKSLFSTMIAKNEIQEVAQQDNQYSYVQRLGETTKAEFTILIKKINIRKGEDEGHAGGIKTVLEVLAYDNCTADGFFTTVMESDWINMPTEVESTKAAITEAIDKGTDRLFYQFNKYMGAWVNNGASFELRFQKLGGARALRSLIGKMRNSPDFGGEMQPYQQLDFTQLRCTFKKKPYDMYDAVLTMADETESLRARAIDAKKQYGRLIVFEPTQNPQDNDKSKAN